MVDTSLDIDIWSRGRDAAQAGRLTTAALKANYQYIAAQTHGELGQLIRLAKEHLDRNFYEQLMFYVQDNCIFFQNPEDAHLIRALRYIY